MVGAYVLYTGTNFLQRSVVAIQAAMSHSARATAQAAAAGRALGAVRAICGFSRIAWHLVHECLLAVRHEI